MREMILNHASVRVPGLDRAKISEWLKDVAEGMGELIRERATQNHLRTAQSLYNTLCSPSYSLFDACKHLGREGYRDQHLFFMKLATKEPLLSDIGKDVENRFSGCQITTLSDVKNTTLSDADGKPLVLCAITDGIAVGFPSDPVWDRSSIEISFEELLPDGTIGEASETIDQLTRSIHASSICERSSSQLLAGTDPRSFWPNRYTIFPNLIFAPGVEENLQRSAALFPTIARKLSEINEAAREWQSTNAPIPPWKTKVTPESQQVMRDPRLQQHRQFQSHAGTQELFEWHARYGNSGRIHLRFESGSREIEIGYVGPHLPLGRG